MMQRRITRFTLVGTAALLIGVLRAGAQTPPQEPPSQASGDTPAASTGEVQTVEEPPAWRYRRDRWGVAVLRVGQDYAQAPGETNRQVVVVLGSAEIGGHVYGDVRVILGQARILSTAVIEGSLVVVGGSALVSPGAQLERDLAVVGGGYDGPADFTPGGESVVIGATSLGGRFAAVVPWFTQGLLWGRLIVPNVGWIWTVVLVFFLVYLAMNVIMADSVTAVAGTLEENPLSTFMAGLLVLLLAGPICVLLAVSIVGIAVIPFVLCALIVAAIVGRVGVVRWIGASVLPRHGETPARAVLPFVVGFVMLIIAYMIPVLGIATWTMVGVFGLGASTLAFIAAYRSERPEALPRPVMPPVAAPPPVQGIPLNSGPTAEAPPVDQPIASMLAAAASDATSFPRASLRDRVAAAFLDLILVVFAAQFLNEIDRWNDAFMFLLLAYHIGFVAWRGTTVGGIICQLRVVKTDGSAIRFVDALVRGLSAIFSALVLGLGFLWILRDPERQAWHDRIAGTYVVRVPRNWPI
jgi:uncharacterized RDD family membrane protein YckC